MKLSRYRTVVITLTIVFATINVILSIGGYVNQFSATCGWFVVILVSMNSYVSRLARDREIERDVRSSD